ncbi:unnamed protein product, partial [Closterium sp. NIES-53]
KEGGSGIPVSPRPGLKPPGTVTSLRTSWTPSSRLPSNLPRRFGTETPGRSSASDTASSSRIHYNGGGKATGVLRPSNHAGEQATSLAADVKPERRSNHGQEQRQRQQDLMHQQQQQHEQHHQHQQQEQPQQAGGRFGFKSPSLQNHRQHESQPTSPLLAAQQQRGHMQPEERVIGSFSAVSDGSDRRLSFGRVESQLRVKEMRGLERKGSERKAVGGGREGVTRAGDGEEAAEEERRREIERERKREREREIEREMEVAREREEKERAEREEREERERLLKEEREKERKEKERRVQEEKARREREEKERVERERAERERKEREKAEREKMEKERKERERRERERFERERVEREEREQRERMERELEERREKERQEELAKVRQRERERLREIELELERQRHVRIAEEQQREKERAEEREKERRRMEEGEKEREREREKERERVRVEQRRREEERRLRWQEEVQRRKERRGDELSGKAMGDPLRVIAWVAGAGVSSAALGKPSSSFGTPYQAAPDHSQVLQQWVHRAAHFHSRLGSDVAPVDVAPASAVADFWRGVRAAVEAAEDVAIAGGEEQQTGVTVSVGACDLAAVRQLQGNARKRVAATEAMAQQVGAFESTCGAAGRGSEEAVRVAIQQLL